jgi:hypothetical protein
MDTIGLNTEEIANLMISLKKKLGKNQEEAIQLNTAQFISQGYSEDEARFRAGIVKTQTIDNSVVAATIDANNKCILLDLKKAGLLSPHT